MKVDIVEIIAYLSIVISPLFYLTDRESWFPYVVAISIIIAVVYLFKKKSVLFSLKTIFITAVSMTPLILIKADYYLIVYFFTIILFVVAKIKKFEMEKLFVVKENEEVN